MLPVENKLTILLKTSLKYFAILLAFSTAPGANVRKNIYIRIMNGSSTSEKLNLMHFYYTRLAKVLFALPLVLSTGYLNQEPCAPLVHPGSSQVCKVSAKVEEERVQTVDQLNRITFFYVSKI